MCVVCRDNATSTAPVGDGLSIYTDTYTDSVGDGLSIYTNTYTDLVG